MADDLANAARILSRAASRLGCSTSDESSPSTSSSAPNSSSEIDTRKELRALFPNHFASSSNARASSHSQSLPRPARFGKRKRGATPKSREVVRKFVCLADKEQSETPDSEENRLLLMSGLGECKISVPEGALENDIRSLLIEQFPPLKEAGGFELMYSYARKRELRVIPPGPNGLPMKYIVSFIGQGKIFIRPIQQDLPLGNSGIQKDPANNNQKETCKKCWATVDVNSLREHYSTCSTDPGSDNDSVLEKPTFSRNDPTSQGKTRIASLTSGIGSDVTENAGSEVYNKYISIIDDWVDDDDNDPEFLAAITASIKDQEATASSSSNEDDVQTESLNDILKAFQIANLQNQVDNPANIVISRKYILPTALRAIGRKTFSFFDPLIVTFAGEMGVDAGGPKREFFRLLMVALRGSAVFQGPWFSHDLNLLSSNKYAEAGKLVAWSALQGGNGPRCLSEEGYNLVRGCVFDKASAIEAVCNADMKLLLEALVVAQSEYDFSKVANKYSDAIAQYGYSRIYTSKFVNKEEIIDCLLKQYFIHGVHSEFAQFLAGMNSIGNFGDIMMAHKSVFDAILGNKQEKLTTSKFKSLYQVDFAERGSNMRNKEESTIYCFELFLRDLEDGEADGATLQDLLIFITGVESPPPLGFDSPITVEFYDYNGKERRRPWSSTCCLSLNLPRGMEDPDEFKVIMKESILECHGFGKG